MRQTVPSSPTQESTGNEQIVRHLLLSFPELEIAHESHDVIDALVEGAICHLLQRTGVSKLVIHSDVAAAIRDVAGLSYEPVELVAAFERLERKGKLSFRDATHRSFIFDETAFRTTGDAFRSRMEAWDAVRMSWIDSVRLRHGLDETQATRLWDGLDMYTAGLVNAYAAEAAAFLFLSDSTGQTRFYEALGQKLPDIAGFVEPELVGIASAEFPLFFDATNIARTDYLTSRLRAAFFFHLLSVDPSASALVREHVTEKVLYLDSNFLFRLVGFNGPALAFAPLTALEISKQLKCKLVVARATIEEFVRVLKARTKFLGQAPIRRDSYLRIAAEHPSDEGAFIAAFYRELRSGSVQSIGEFRTKWSNIRAYLTEWGIEVDEEATVSPEEAESSSFLDQLSSLNQWHRGEKPIDAVEHDVFMLRLIRAKRGKADLTPAGTRQWFLTFDRQLMRYAAHYATEAHLPPCLLTEDWLQISRPFLPRTDDYAKSFVTMLRHPILFQTAPVPFEHIAASLSRLERYEELPATVVAAMVADGQFMRSFSSVQSDEAARDLFETEVAAIATDISNKNETLRADLERSRGQSATIQADADTLRDARDAEERARREAERSAAAASEELAALSERLAKTEEERDTEFTTRTLLETRVGKLQSVVEAGEKRQQLRRFITLDVILPALFTILVIAIVISGLRGTATTLPSWRRGLALGAVAAMALLVVAHIRMRGLQLDHVAKSKAFRTFNRWHKWVYAALIVPVAVNLLSDLIQAI
jgi:hypothetical protein